MWNIFHLFLEAIPVLTTDNGMTGQKRGSKAKPEWSQNEENVEPEQKT